MTLFLETSHCLLCETQMREFLENGDKATDCSSAWKASAGAEAKELRPQYDCGRKNSLGLSIPHTTNDLNSLDFLAYVHPFKKASSLHSQRSELSSLQCHGSLTANLDLNTDVQLTPQPKPLLMSDPERSTEPLQASLY